MSKDDDKFMKKLLRSKDKAEARGWLAGHSDKHYRNIAELSHADSSALVTKLYGLGVAELSVAEIKINEPYESATILLFKLPTDTIVRGHIFDWISNHSQQEGFEPVEDHGQEYEFAWFD